MKIPNSMDFRPRTGSKHLKPQAWGITQWLKVRRISERPASKILRRVLPTWVFLYSHQVECNQRQCLVTASSHGGSRRLSTNCKHRLLFRAPKTRTVVRAEIEPRGRLLSHTLLWSVRVFEQKHRNLCRAPRKPPLLEQQPRSNLHHHGVK